MSVCLSVCLPVCLSVCVCVCLSVCMSVYRMYKYVRMKVHNNVGYVGTYHSSLMAKSLLFPSKGPVHSLEKE